MRQSGPKDQKREKVFSTDFWLGLEHVHVSTKLETEGMGAILRSAKGTI